MELDVDVATLDTMVVVDRKSGELELELDVVVTLLVLTVVVVGRIVKLELRAAVVVI